MSAAHRADAPGGTSHTRALGFWMTTSLVIGNMIGSGIFLLPAALAPFRGYAIASWLITAAGSVALAVTFARLSRRIPRAGGPYVFARDGFGEFAGFFIAWGYWISVLASTAAIATALTSYLTVFWPALNSGPWLAATATLAAIWLLTALNAAGVRHGGRMQLATVILKLAPLVLIGTVGLFFVHSDAFVLAPPPGSTPLSSLNAAIALTLWAFLGFETASVPADSVVDPQRTIPRATIVGTVLTAVVYIASTVAVMGILPAATLAASSAPFADASAALWGGWAGYLMGAGAVVSCFGALNGWILVQGQIPMAMARDGLFPSIFASTRSDGTPAAGLVISSVIVTVLLIFNFTGTLVEIFTKTILLATLTAVVPYVFAALAELRFTLAAGNGGSRTSPGTASPLGGPAVPIAGFLFAMWAVIGAGQETVYLGFILLLAGLPIYVWLKRRTPIGP